MRIETLQLRYGMFCDAALDFGTPGQAPDLSIVLGSNEAGKTTLTDAVADLLFGFERSTPHAYLHDPALLRIGAVLQDGGGPLEVIRRKGNSKTLLAPDGAPIDEEPLRAMLKGHDRESYRRSLSLDQRRLREGGRMILSDADQAGRAILAAGTGLDGLARVARRLDEEADAIWAAKRAGRRTYYAAQSSLEESKARLQKATRRPSEWEAAMQRREEIMSDLHRLRAERDDCAREREEVELTRRILVPLVRHGAVKQELEALGAVPSMPSDAASILRESGDEILVAAASIRESSQAIEESNAEASAIVINEPLLAASREIQALIGTSGAVERSLRQLPSCRSRLSEVSVKLADRLSELGDVGLPGADGRVRLPDRADIAELKELLDRQGALAMRVEAARAGAASRREEMNLLKTECAALPAAIDRSPVEAALRTARMEGDLAGKALRARHAAHDWVEKLDVAIAALAPWSGNAEALRATALISDDLASRHSNALNDVTGKLRDVEQARRRGSDELQRVAVEITQLSNARVAVPESELLTARRDRDMVWGDIRSGLASKAGLAKPDVISVTFEEKVLAADSVADRRYLSAEDSARLMDLERRSERLCLELDQMDQELSLVRQRRGEAERAWRRLLDERGLPAIPSPEEYRDWKRLADLALMAAQKTDELASEAHSLDILAEGVVSTLLSALRLSGVDGPAAAEHSDDGLRPLGLLIDAAERFLAAEIERERLRSTLLARQQDAERADMAASKAFAQADEELAGWQDSFEQVLRRVGFNASLSPSRARYLVEAVTDARMLKDEASGLEQRISALLDEQARFETRARALARRCSIAGSCEDVQALVGRLADEVARASRAADRHQALSEMANAADARRKEARIALARAELRLEPLVHAAGTTDRAEIAHTIQRSIVRADREKLAEQLVAEILQNGEGRSLERLAEECSGQDPAGLAARSAALQTRWDAISEEVERLTAERVAAEADLARFGAGLDAAAAAADVQQALAALDHEAALYITKRIQSCVLNYAVARHRAEQEAPLLRRASSLFNRLTLGRYAALAIDREHDDPRLVALLGDGSTIVPASSLSDGAADQIYLALRIAAIEARIDAGIVLPVLIDDVCASFDDQRAAASFGIIGELASRTQVLFMTHHSHLASLAAVTLGAGLRVVSLG